MFTGQVSVRRLRPREVCLRVVNDINDLLRRQHSEAGRVDEEGLLAQVKRSKVAVAWNDGDRVIGLGVLIKIPLMAHSYAKIHYLAVCKGSDRLSIGKRIVDLLVEGVGDVAFIEAGALPNDGELIDLLAASGFKPKHKLRYRLKIKPPKAAQGR